MNKVFLLLGALMVAVAVSSCSRRSARLTYTPSATLSVEEAKRVIHRSLVEQPVWQVANIEITEKTLAFSPTTRGGAVSRRRTVFYFDSLGKMDMTEKRRGWVVRVWDMNDVYRFRVVIPNPDRARRFMDSLHVMSLQAKGIQG